MLVKNWMRQPAIAIDADDVVAAAAALLQKHEIHMLPVMQKGQLVGIVTDRDIKRASPSDILSENRIVDSDLLSGIKVKEIMTPDPVTVPYNYMLQEAAELLCVNEISGLPVVNQAGSLIGIITKSDIFQLLLLLSGIGKKGIHLALELKDRPGKLYEIIELACDYGGRVSSLIATYERAKPGSRRLYIRIDDIDKPSSQCLKEVIEKKAKLLYILDTHAKTREIF